MFRPQDLPLLAVFEAVVRTGSFTAAAKELGLTKSLVSERVRALEERCDVTLLERSTRRLRLTQVGAEVLSVATTVLRAAADVSAIVDEHRASPVGTLRVTSTHDLASRFVGPVAAKLATRYPKLYVQIVADDAARDLIEGGFDVGVRLGVPRDSAYSLRRLAMVHEVVVAAPSLVATRPSLARPADLDGAPWVRHALLPREERIVLHGPRGEKESVAVSLRADANTGDGVRGLLRGGLGFGALPLHLASDDLARGLLLRACPKWTVQEIAIFAVLPSGKRAPRRVELFVAALKETLRAGEVLSGANLPVPPLA